MSRLLAAALSLLLCCGSAWAQASPVAAIGRKIFFDPRMSASGKLACASCHDPRYAYGPAPGRGLVSGGPRGDRPGTRAIPSLRYIRWVPPFEREHRFLDGDLNPMGGYTWDGRAASIREQVSIPLLAPNEMANASPREVVYRLRRSPYAGQVRAVFGDAVYRDVDRCYEAVLIALDAFLSTPEEFFPFSSRYDAFLRGEIELSEQEERGAALFKDPRKGNCASCHVASRIGGLPPLFTDFDFANVGVPRNRRIAANADPSYFDLGLCGPARTDLREERKVCGYFRAPSLRNTALRDAYFHNGAFGSLREVLDFYVLRDLQPERFYPRDAAGQVHKADDLPPGLPVQLDQDPPLDRKPGDPPALTAVQIEDIIAFLGTLTDADAAR
jgi:cytochrome c peroxidase